MTGLFQATVNENPVWTESAQESAKQAAASATAAAASADTATNAASTATAAVAGIGAAVTRAETAATTATAQATTANTAATNAQAWAIKTDGPVSDGEYSAKYWAQRAGQTGQYLPLAGGKISGYLEIGDNGSSALKVLPANNSDYANNFYTLRGNYTSGNQMEAVVTVQNGPNIATYKMNSAGLMTLPGDISSPTFSGSLKSYIDSKSTSGALPLAGGTMTGPIKTTIGSADANGSLWSENQGLKFKTANTVNNTYMQMQMYDGNAEFASVATLYGSGYTISSTERRGVKLQFGMPDVVLASGYTYGKSSVQGGILTPDADTSIGVFDITASRVRGSAATNPGTQSAVFRHRSDGVAVFPGDIQIGDGSVKYGADGDITAPIYGGKLSDFLASISGGGAPGVTAFNGRTGLVVPADGDYTAAQVGAYTKAEVDTLVAAGVGGGMKITPVVSAAASLAVASSHMGGVVLLNSLTNAAAGFLVSLSPFGLATSDIGKSIIIYNNQSVKTVTVDGYYSDVTDGFSSRMGSTLTVPANGWVELVYVGLNVIAPNNRAWIVKAIRGPRTTWAMTPGAGWVAGPGNARGCAVTQVGDDLFQLTLNLTGGAVTDATTIATLVASLAPATEVILVLGTTGVARAAGGDAYVTIGTDGTLKIYNVSTGARLLCNGLYRRITL